MNCPRHPHVELTEVKVADMVLDRCPECGGVWFDFGQLERVVTRDTRSLRKLMPEKETPPTPHEGTLECPHCGADLIPMRRQPGPIEYHGCLTCYGRWLDGVRTAGLIGPSLAVKLEELFQKLLD